PTIGALVAARAVQGVGGALFTPLTLTMLSAVTPPGRRGAVLGAWGGIGGLGAALGPLAGGALAGSVGWRAIFWLNVPLGLAPMLPMRFFRSRVFAAGAMAALAMYAALFGALFLITQLLQAGLGATPLQAGLRTLPMAVMPLLLAPVGGVITDRIGFRPLIIC